MLQGLLLGLFDALLAPSGTIFLAHDGRRPSLPQFLKLAEKDFGIATMVRKLRSEEEELTVGVNRRKRKG